MLPGVDPADVIPALAEKRAPEQAARERARAAEDAAFDAWIEGERRLLAAMRDELNEIKAELARRRRLAEQTKYSPDQPRLPAGNPRGGQWTDRSGGSGNSYDATPSTGAVTDARSEGDGTRGYDDRLVGSDKPTPGRAAMLGIVARAAERAIEAYRSGNLLVDMFGNKGGAVVVTTIDDRDIFGSNSTSATYTDADFKAAV
jgi:hypothetical protein